jgi:hypothetical protein
MRNVMVILAIPTMTCLLGCGPTTLTHAEPEAHSVHQPMLKEGDRVTIDYMPDSNEDGIVMLSTWTNEMDRFNGKTATVTSVYRDDDGCDWVELDIAGKEFLFCDKWIRRID